MNLLSIPTFPLLRLFTAGNQEAPMNIIIAGGGKVGANLTRMLTTEGHDITLIDTDHRILQSIQEHTPS